MPFGHPWGAPDAAALPAATTSNGGALLDTAPSPVPARVLERFGRASVLLLRMGSRRQLFAPMLSVHPLLPVAYAGRTVPPICAIGDALVAWSADGLAVGGTALSGSGWDWHLRRELVVRVLARAANSFLDGSGVPTLGNGLVLAWSRPGPADSEDADHGWWAAARSAADEVGVSVACLLVVTRWGWWTLPEGPSRRWARLRDRSSVLGPHAAAAIRH